jgi:hypothetical protein
LSATATAAAFLLLVGAQIVAQRPAAEGVLVIHLGRAGELRLWNQPLRPQDLPVVPWGMVHALLSRLGPTTPQDPWTLQLQLP